jgi:glutamate--cysteine ligase
MADKSQIITSKNQLVDYVEAGCAPKSDWRIGTEHEKFCFHKDDFSPLEYEGPSGIKAVLEGFVQFGWDPTFEEGNIISLTKDGASVTLEPGGQLELSGAPVETIHQTCSEIHTHLYQAKQIGDALGVGFLGMGYHPELTAKDMPHMPKGRYDIMRAYMPTKGDLGLDMMHSSCTVQVNLDYASEADMVKKFRVALALQPIATALFANSPFTNGKPNGYKSFRSHLWTDTDPDRTGMLPFVFEDGFGFERWVDYVIDVPMYFAYRDGYLPCPGASFRDFMAGKLDILPGEIPTLSDWEDQLTMPFPEVRVKSYMEMRGADGGPWSKLCALPAFWVGLMYESGPLDAAWDMVKDWSFEEMQQLRNDVPKMALQAPFRGGKLQDIACEILEMSYNGLKTRSRAGKIDADEASYLDTLRAAACCGQTPADVLLEAYHGKWNKNASMVFAEYNY